ncbi:beta-eliminating lyase-related protein [Geobacillus sp. BK01]|uniref:beta-eliminating lyase-related protein n=1 Tax=Geobacillus sp. BK01 TaxID=3457328 RepID=UPI003FA57735
MDFRSDTVTKPAPEMCRAMFDAEVGDDVYDVAGVETNIVLCDIHGTGLSNDEFVARLKEAGILASPFDDGVIRFVTHRKITADSMQTASERMRRMLS